MISLPAEIARAIVVHADNSLPSEACGLLAGDGHAIRFFYPMTNLRQSPVSYEVDPAGHIGALRHAESRGWQLVGVFHSHPASPAAPSATDVAHALEPEWLHVILGTDGLRAWTIVNGTATEEAVQSPL